MGLLASEFASTSPRIWDDKEAKTGGSKGPNANVRLQKGPRRLCKVEEQGQRESVAG